MSRPSPSKRIYVEQDDDGWVIGDDEGEFARATQPADALRYVADLIYGPGTGPRGFIWNAMRHMDEQRQKAMLPDLDDLA